jgi:carbamoyltransferase
VRILGFADNHDSSAAIVVDGRLVAACGQERIDRVKNSGVFPWGAIDAVMDRSGLRYRDIDRIVCGTAFTPSFLLRRFPALHRDRKQDGGQFSYALNLYYLYQSALRASGLHGLEVEACRKLLEDRLEERPFQVERLDMVDHHTAHAEAAYRTQPRDRCLVFTVDAMGDGHSVTVRSGRDSELTLLFAQNGLAAINTYYSRTTEYLGFRPNRHEGKITGLAAFAEPPEALLVHYRSLLRFVGPGLSTLNMLARQGTQDPFYRVLEGYSREEIAAALQTVLEEALSALVDHWVRETGIADVAVCGGVFANVKLNQRIAQLPAVDSLWVYPNMGDGGLAAGGALAAASPEPKELDTLYLGPEFSSSVIARELNIAGLRPKKPKDLGREVAQLLADGKVVARFDGGMEWGPRALGNRTLLYRPDDPSVNDWLNKRLKRTEFMPFAPMVMAEDAESLFRGYAKAPQAARYMTVCFDALPPMAQLGRGVVHVDGTARPQVVHADDNPQVHRILHHFRELTGLPALINTSFNLHEEPIVCSPFDAIRAWKQGGLDALAIGPYLVRATG